MACMAISQAVGIEMSISESNQINGVYESISPETGGPQEQPDLDETIPEEEYVEEDIAVDP